MTSNGQFTSWPVFLQALQTRFAPSQYEDPTGALCKLMHKGLVATYLAKFEDLANRVVDVPPLFLLSCFVSGLLSEIRREVQAHQPLTIYQAAGLARLQEDKLSDHRPPPPPPRPRPPPLPNPNPIRPNRLPPLLSPPPCLNPTLAEKRQVNYSNKKIIDLCSMLK